MLRYKWKIAHFALTLGFFMFISANIQQVNAQQRDVGNIKNFIKLQMDLAGKTVQCDYDTFYFNGHGNVFFDEEVIYLTRSNVLVNSKTKLVLYFPPTKTRKNEIRQEFEKKGNEIDGCNVSDGYGRFLEMRHHMVRESVCGNDPETSCEVALERLCGIGASQMCANKNRRLLSEISKTSQNNNR